MREGRISSRALGAPGARRALFCGRGL